MEFVVYKKHPALDLWSTTSSPRGICCLRREVRVGFEVYRGHENTDLFEICRNYFLSWASHGSNPGGGKTLFSSPKRPDRL